MKQFVVTSIKDLPMALSLMREFRGFTVTKLAQIMGRAYSPFLRYENGIHTPKLSTIERIADTLDMDMVITFTPRKK